MTPYNPDSWIDVLGLVIAGLTVILAAVLPVWVSSRRQRSIQSEVREVRNQVQNNHVTNLRDDIDKIHSAVQSVQEHQWEHSRAISGLHTVVDQLRKEVNDEVSNRIAADEHIKLEIHRSPDQ